MEARIALEAGVNKAQAIATLKLLDEGNTVPFIARYRKEATANLDEVQIRDVASAAERIRALEARRTFILNSIREQGNLNKKLEISIREAFELTVLEDLYAPFKPKRQTRATKAIDAGLEPIATALKNDQDVWTMAKSKTSDAFPEVSDVIDGAKDIIAEELSTNPRARRFVRAELQDQGNVSVKKRRGSEVDPKYQGYYDFIARVSRIKPHQVLAIRRGENEKALSATIVVDDDRIIREIDHHVNTARRNRKLMKEAIEDGYRRLLKPGVERDVRGELDATADEHAINVFGGARGGLRPEPDRSHHQPGASEPRPTV